MFILNHIPTCRLFDDGSCVIRCQTGRYAMGRQCHLCHHTCHECTDEGPDNCTSCDRGTPSLVKIWKTLHFYLLLFENEMPMQPKKEKTFLYFVNQLLQLTGSVSSAKAIFTIIYIGTISFFSFPPCKTCTLSAFEVTQVAICRGALVFT